MKRYIKHGIVTGSIIIIVLIIILSVFMKPDLSYSTGRDTYIAFGDGRFQMLNPGDRMILRDEEFDSSLISAVEKYIKKEGRLYVKGAYANSGIDYDNPDLPYFYYNIQTGELLTYYSLDEIPKYTILNYETGEVEFYLVLEDVPSSDREVFEKEINWWCELRRTCYKE